MSVGAVSASNSLVDGRRLSLVLATISAMAAVAHRVDRRPFLTCVKCPSTIGVTFVRQYRATLSALRPGNERKLLALTAQRNVDLTGNPTV